MFHLGFFMLPEPGHVLPSLNVARSLEQKGHQVTFLSTPALSNYFAKHGFQSCTIFKSAFPDTSTDILSAEEGTTVQRRLFNYLKATGGGFADLLAAEIVDLGFDILVCDAWIIHSFGDDLVRTLQIPIVSLSVVFPDQERKQVPSIPEVVLCPKELDIPTRTWKSNHAKTFFAEPSLFETGRQNKDAVDFVSPNKPLVYCSFGTQTLRYPTASIVFANIVKAFSRITSHRLAISWSNNPKLLSSVTPTPNVHLLQSAPQLELLKMSDLFITHGGLGALKETIMLGVPALVIPFDKDQPENAARVAYHRVGYRCEAGNSSPQELVELVNALLHDKDVQFQTSQMRSMFWRYEFARPSSDIILRAARGEFS